jgi:hypothetical protein
MNKKKKLNWGGFGLMGQKVFGEKKYHFSPQLRRTNRKQFLVKA